MLIRLRSDSTFSVCCPAPARPSRSSRSSKGRDRTGGVSCGISGVACLMVFTRNGRRIKGELRKGHEDALVQFGMKTDSAYPGHSDDEHIRAKFTSDTAEEGRTRDPRQSKK